LVTLHEGLVFNYAWYLDALNCKWGVLFTDEHKQKGIAVPYTTHLGISAASIPYFFRSASWIGHFQKNEKKTVLQNIQTMFKGTHFNFADFNCEGSALRYQQILPQSDFFDHYNTLCKRMIKKACKNAITLGNEWDKTYFLDLLTKNLSKKVKMWGGPAMHNFEKLVLSLQANNCFHFVEIKHNNLPAGGLIIMQTAKRHIYLKGICEESVKKDGGMYLAMNKAIERAMKANVVFDFGGSRVDSVAQFNHHFGADDCYYNELNWNKLPIWFNVLKQIKNKWR
jgi:hypothetical protein